MTGRRVRVGRVGRALPPLGDEFVSVEVLGATVLLAATVLALVWANVAAHSYDQVWHHPLDLSVGGLDLDLSVAHWITDGLMAVFFFVVGLEIKREVVRGELRDPRTASLPVIAAVGGMVLPAVLFVLWNAGGDGAHGWAVPMATDIAFATGVLALLGSRVPRPLKLFLLTLAIVDDLGAILVIAIFYSGGVRGWWLLAAAAVVLGILGLQRLGVAPLVAYVVPAVALWLCVQQSGVHATIAGVALGLLTPARPFGGRQVIEGLEHRLHPWSSFAIVPLFALANAGITIDGTALRQAASSPVTVGVVVGLVLGKSVGVAGATFAGARLGLGRLPEGVRTADVIGVAMVAGIGFTVALFIAGLAFGPAHFQLAVIGILTGSVLSGLLATACFLLRSPA
ncbi:MAG: Na+/H+ antiporter NhaA [Actinomycetes bacterium]